MSEDLAGVLLGAPPLGVCLFRLMVAAFCGAALGLERRHSGHAMGMRTLILISVSSCLLSIVSQWQAGFPFDGVKSGDPTRIAAQVVSGVGFLGGGCIIKQGVNIKGLTSAAIIWATAAIGLAAGAGLTLLAVATSAFLLAVVLALSSIEKEHKSCGNSTLLPTRITIEVQAKTVSVLPILRSIIEGNYASSDEDARQDKIEGSRILEEEVTKEAECITAVYTVVPPKKEEVQKIIAMMLDNTEVVRVQCK